jgi:hypothetical protein
MRSDEVADALDSMSNGQRGRPLAIDDKAAPASPTKLGFLAGPEGAPVYYGFVVLDDVVIDGFMLGNITDWEAGPCETGDAFVIAADGSRAGLIWQIREKQNSTKFIHLKPADGEFGDSISKFQ